MKARQASTAGRQANRLDRREHRGASFRPLLTAFVLSLAALEFVGLAGARPARAADPTLTPLPFQQGHHVYDNGNLLSSHSVATAEALAAHIESQGGGRVVVFTAGDTFDIPSTLATDWSVNGLLITADKNFGQYKVGLTLKGKLTSAQLSYLDGYSTPGPATTESWILSDLARIDAFVSGTHVFDGTGLLDPAHKQQAETAATNLGSQLGGTVYVDIAVGGDDPSNTAFFNGAGSTTDFDKTLMIALAVTGDQIGGYLYDSDLFGSYASNAPWKNSKLDNETAPGGDVQGALIAAINAVQKPPLISADAIPVIVFVVVVVIFSITAPFVWGPWLIRRIAGVSAPMKGGIPSSATIQSISDTGVTVSMSGVGAEAPDYKFGLAVNPPGGGTPYEVEIKALVPRIYLPMIVPGAQIGVLIDPADPRKVQADFSRMGAAAGPGAAAAFAAGGAFTAGDAAPAGGFNMNFDASGQPAAADIAALAGGVHSGTITQHSGSAAQLLATGTHGTAVITTAMPLGKSVHDVNPSADPARWNDPIWLFTVEVSLAGQAPFPAVFGHRVPPEKLGAIAPGVKLSVAVNEVDRNEEVAIDWDRSPIA